MCLSELPDILGDTVRKHVSERVLFETVFTLQRYHRVPLPQIKDLLLPIFDLRGLRLPWKHLCIAALDLQAD
jgi:hypothetical protein